MRQASGSGGGKRTISATPRQLESCIRLAEALAKMELSAEVRPAHVAEALRLMKAALQSAAVDPLTGQIDMDLITTGRSARARAQLHDLAAAVRLQVQELAPGQTLLVQELWEKLQEGASLPVGRQELDEVLAQLAEEDVLVLAGARQQRSIRRNL